jgi:hypothetical protein
VQRSLGAGRGYFRSAAFGGWVGLQLLVMKAGNIPNSAKEAYLCIYLEN